MQLEDLRLILSCIQTYQKIYGEMEFYQTFTGKLGYWQCQWIGKTGKKESQPYNILVKDDFSPPDGGVNLSE